MKDLSKYTQQIVKRMHALARKGYSIRQAYKIAKAEAAASK